MWRIGIVILVALAGFWFGKERAASPEPKLAVHPEKEWPVTERKSFAILLYAHNQTLWCERALRSIFEQEYDHYRVIVIDDGSVDGTGEKAKQFIVDNNQEAKVILIRNEAKWGPVASLYRAIDSCLDREVVLPLDAKDWLAHPHVLSRLNAAYQNPDVWLTAAPVIEYPSYAIQPPRELSFYAALFKQIQLQDLFQNGHFTTASASYLTPLMQMAAGRVRQMEEPLAFLNTASPTVPEKPLRPTSHYHALRGFPAPKESPRADVLLFSFDRPLQLYACLESLQRYITGFSRVTVLYRASTLAFEAGYEKVKDAFPLIQFVAQSTTRPKSDFKPQVMKILFDSPSQYILFGVDDIVVKDFVDLNLCMDQMEKTGAYGFYLRLGRHIRHCYQTNEPQGVPTSLPLASHIYAYDMKTAEADWAFPNSLDMTLFRKEQLKNAFSAMKYKTPNSLEFNWANGHCPERAIGLYFEASKMVNIPLNIVGRTGNPHMNYLTAEELLAKFNQGLKIDIEPLYKVENASPHFEYIPDFIAR
jgi:glycosyltransferase involved in cell wall biosynthesis